MNSADYDPAVIRTEETKVMHNKQNMFELLCYVKSKHLFPQLDNRFVSDTNLMFATIFLITKIKFITKNKDLANNFN